MVRMFVLKKSGLGLYLGHLGSKTRSLGQIIEKPCEGNRGHMHFNPALKWINVKLWLQSGHDAYSILIQTFNNYAHIIKW